MKTNRMLMVVRLVVLGVLVAAFNAKPASAQVCQGKFTLPSTTRWGRATLPAGDYSFTLGKYTAGSLLTVYRGKRAVAMILNQVISDPTSGRSAMVLEGGTVRELSLPQIGEAFHYSAPNPRHREEPQVAQIIPVAVTGAGR